MMPGIRRWIGGALLAQPFYAEEIRMIGLLAQTLRHRLPDPLPWRSAAR